ncbi:nuclear pore complex protein NUP54 isoform X1 [Primulina tabacum]|uniref:nuclear pore complex protein NUP54 isoform X1 n=1 Tax=Primulina tabacum TaxID=48773 RepID=UPI003F5986C6
MFGAQSSSSATTAFGTPGFGTSLFSTPFSQQSHPQHQQTPSIFQTPQLQQQLQTPSIFQTPQPQQSSGTPFGLENPFNTAAQSQVTPFTNASPAFQFSNSQLTTQMAPVAPLPFSLPDRDIQAIVDAYKEEHGNPKYAFKHLLYSVTEPQQRIKPAGVSDILWADAMGKLEGMESSLWPQLVQGFKDLSNRLKLQDEVILSDSERLRMTQNNVKMLQRHFQADTLPWIQRMQQKEQGLQRRLLRLMRIIESLEGKGCRLPLMKGEAELAEKLAMITRQLKGSGAELVRRVQNLLALSRLQADGLNGGSLYFPGSTKIHEQSLAEMQEMLQQQIVAIAGLGNVLKRDIRDTEIIMAEDTEMSQD